MKARPRARADFLMAWDIAMGPDTALKIMRAAIEDAIGAPPHLVDENLRPLRDDLGFPVCERRASDFGALQAILPYVVRKLPQAIESVDGDGAIVLKVVNYASHQLPVSPLPALPAPQLGERPS